MTNTDPQRREIVDVEAAPSSNSLDGQAIVDEMGEGAREKILKIVEESENSPTTHLSPQNPFNLQVEHPPKDMSAFVQERGMYSQEAYARGAYEKQLMVEKGTLLERVSDILNPNMRGNHTFRGIISVTTDADRAYCVAYKYDDNSRRNYSGWDEHPAGFDALNNLDNLDLGFLNTFLLDPEGFANSLKGHQNEKVILQRLIEASRLLFEASQRGKGAEVVMKLGLGKNEFYNTRNEFTKFLGKFIYEDQSKAYEVIYPNSPDIENLKKFLFQHQEQIQGLDWTKRNPDNHDSCMQAFSESRSNIPPELIELIEKTRIDISPIVRMIRNNDVDFARHLDTHLLESSTGNIVGVRGGGEASQIGMRLRDAEQRGETEAQGAVSEFLAQNQTKIEALADSVDKLIRLDKEKTASEQFEDGVLSKLGQADFVRSTLIKLVNQINEISLALDNQNQFQKIINRFRGPSKENYSHIAEAMGGLLREDLGNLSFQELQARYYEKLHRTFLEMKDHRPSAQIADEGSALLQTIQEDRNLVEKLVGLQKGGVVRIPTNHNGVANISFGQETYQYSSLWDIIRLPDKKQTRN
jgi:hypothetical protein